MIITSQEIRTFQDCIWQFYQAHGRSFEWRHVQDPYQIVVSEIMLQQTQTHRVAQKFSAFIKAFPTFDTLAQASLQEVLFYWQGLGYNRRGLYLQHIAKKIIDEYNGQLPNDPAILVNFPGIGPATASSICAFAFNRPTVFIETNIRTVYIYFFFASTHDKVADKQLIPIIEQTVDTTNPREWYYALMDYGVFLKKSAINPSRKSAHHAKQSKFEGSDRQIRGMILRYVLQSTSPLTLTTLCTLIDRDADRIEKISQQLCAEGFIVQTNGFFSIK